MRKLLVFGATSAIAQAVIRLYAAEGARLFLVARDADKLESVAADARVRGADRVAMRIMTAEDFDQHQHLVEEAERELGGLDTALIAHGTLPDQHACELSFEPVQEAFEINALAVISLATHIANRFEASGHGTLAVVSSVAGDRGRASNYVYGAAKAAVDTFLSGLRNRLYPSGIAVITLKPGFVDTPMTAAFKKGLLWAQPENVAQGIYRAIASKNSVVYLPWYWRWVMLVIRHIPNRVFNHLKL